MGVLSEEPENYTAQLGLSLYYFKQKKYEEAEDILERMGIKHPDDSKDCSSVCVCTIKAEQTFRGRKPPEQTLCAGF